MRRLGIVTAILIFLGCSVAQADPIQFELTAGSDTLTWVLDQDPAPVLDVGNGFEIANIVASLNGADFLVPFTRFFLGSSAGGFQMRYSNIDWIIDTTGPQLFGGTTAAPQFLLGTYSLSDYGFPCGFCSDPDVSEYSLTISAISVPEPSTLALLGIGLFGMGLARRKKA